MPVVLESPQPGRHDPSADPATDAGARPTAGDDTAAPPAPHALTEGVEVTLCLADLPEADRTLDKLADGLWQATRTTRFEVASITPLPGGARIHFLIRDGGPADDGTAALDLVGRIGVHYRWVGIKRTLCSGPSDRSH